MLLSPSCSKEKNINPDVIPQSLVTEDDLIGTWETYYSNKVLNMIFEDPSKNQNLGGFRDVSYDGFKTIFYKEGGIYKVKSLNAFGTMTNDSIGTYSVKKDSLTFLYRDFETKKPVYQYWKVTQFGEDPGIIRMVFTYTGSIADQGNYRVQDFRVSRNINVAPTAQLGVLKSQVNFDDLCRGRWEFVSAREYVDNTLNLDEVNRTTANMSGTSYIFYTADDGQKMLEIKQVLADGTTGSNYFPIVITDDVINWLYWDDEKEKWATTYIWITDKQTTKGVDTFVDKAEERLESNIFIIMRSEWTFKRIID